MMPIFNLLRPIAPLAWIPLAILWFGIGEKYKYFLIFIAAFVPFTLNAFAGASHVDKQLVGAARMLALPNRSCSLRSSCPPLSPPSSPVRRSPCPTPG